MYLLSNTTNLFNKNEYNSFSIKKYKCWISLLPNAKIIQTAIDTIFKYKHFLFTSQQRKYVHYLVRDMTIILHSIHSHIYWKLHFRCLCCAINLKMIPWVSIINNRIYYVNSYKFLKIVTYLFVIVMEDYTEKE